MNEQPQSLIIEPEHVLARMRQGKKTIFDVRLGEQVFVLRVLTIDETNAIRRQAIAETLQKGGDNTDRDVLISKYTLKLASNIHKGGAPFITDQLLSGMYVDEVNALYDEYSKKLDDVNPRLEQMSPDQFRALVEAIKKNSISANDCSLLHLKAIFGAYQDLIQRLDAEKLPKGS